MDATIANVRILDLSGHVVKVETLENDTFKTEGLKAGVYMVELNQNGKKALKKFIEE